MLIFYSQKGSTLSVLCIHFNFTSCNISLKLVARSCPLSGMCYCNMSLKFVARSCPLSDMCSSPGVVIFQTCVRRQELSSFRHVFVARSCPLSCMCSCNISLKFVARNCSLSDMCSSPGVVLFQTCVRLQELSSFRHVFVARSCPRSDMCSSPGVVLFQTCVRRQELPFFINVFL